MPLLHESARKGAEITEREVAEVVEDLNKVVQGEVRMDTTSRMLYSTDASLYQMQPVGVVVPRTADDVEAAIKVAGKHGIPVTPRGGGTGLAGQTVNHGIMIDFSKYMRQILEVNQEEHWARVQPGVVVNHLSQAMGQYGLLYAPDPVSGTRATVGGGIGNNSCGTHSVIYGKTLDHVLEVEAVLSDGSRAHFQPTEGVSLEQKMLEESLEGRIYREVRRLAHENREEIERRFPKIQRRVSGYNLDEFVGDGPMNLARMAVGSEGTLIAVTEAKMNLMPLPKVKGLAGLHFTGLVESMEATVAILEHGPSAVEFIGSMAIKRCAELPSFRHLLDWVEGMPESILFVEFYGDSELEVKSKLDNLQRDMAQKGLGYATVTALEKSKMEHMWDLRRAGLGLLGSVRGDGKSVSFVEDTAVSPEKLPEYVVRFDQILKKYDTEAGYYGHAGVGCLHIRPVVNVKSVEGVRTIQGIAEEVADLVLEFGGSLSGEHGDGIARGYFTQKMFGEEMYNVFRELKQAFDPDSTMNPGKIIDTPLLAEFWRVSPETKNLEVETYTDFSLDGGFAGHVEMCNGQGACRKIEGVMCPSFMVTREEEHSTRGRANLMRMVLSGVLPPSELTGKRLYDALDLCVECKGCKSECPSNVDMARLKSEVLAKYHKVNGTPMRARFFANVNLLSRIGSATAPIANFMNKLPMAKWVASRIVGLHPDRPLPVFASQSFPSWFRKHTSRATETARGEVVLFNDTFMDYYHPEVGQATTRILEALGYQVTLVDQRQCCGRPAISKGLLGQAKGWARQNVDALLPYAQRGVPIVGAEPSCLLTLRDEYPDLLQDQASKTVASQAFMLEELLDKLLTEEPEVASIFREDVTAEIQVHGHCHMKSVVGMDPTMRVLNAVPGYSAQLIDSSCCGMAGSFGFEKEHYDISKAMGSLKLFPAIEAEEARDAKVAILGISCRQQIDHFTSKQSRHVAEYLADALQ
ncbi:MAG: FAD-binding protein [Chloroflexi bacterium]|nr:FAD-binding protein [Chloroflexota bacterium]